MSDDNSVRTGAGIAQLSAVDSALLDAAYLCDFEALKSALENGAMINVAHPENGMTALHLAVVRNQRKIVRYLVGQGAEIGPDGFGRWPSLLAATGGAKPILMNYVLSLEEKSEDHTE